MLLIFIRFTSNSLHLYQLEVLGKVANKPVEDVAVVTEEMEMAMEVMVMEGMVIVAVDVVVVTEMEGLEMERMVNMVVDWVVTIEGEEEMGEDQKLLKEFKRKD